MTQPYLFDFFEAGGRGRASRSEGSRRAGRPGRPFEVNPYRRCGFACCALQAVGEGDFRIAPPPIAFRPGIARALDRALDRGRCAGRELVLGAQTDPYQPLEAETGLTRAILGSLAMRRGLSIKLRTKSPLLMRDLELLRLAADGNRLRVEIPLMSRDEGLPAILEPGAPCAERRLRLLGDLAGEGINAGLLIEPVVPGLNDSLGDLEALLRAARRRGAHFADWAPLALEPAPRGANRRCPHCPTGLFLDRVRSIAPQLADRLENIHLGREPAPSFCRRLVATRMRELKLKYGFAELDAAAPPPRVPLSEPSPAQTKAG